MTIHNFITALSYSFPNVEPVCCSMLVLTVASWPAYIFLRRQVRCSGIVLVFSFLWKLSTACCNYTVNGFGIVNEAEVYVFLELLCFSMIQWMLAIWSLVPLLFLNSACAWGSSQSLYSWNLTWRILNIKLLACEMSVIVWQFEHFLALAVFRIGIKSDLFQSCGHCWVFQICWPFRCSILTITSLRNETVQLEFLHLQ